MPIRATPPPRSGPDSVGKPAPKITRLSRTPKAPSTPADRIARLRKASAQNSTTQKQQSEASRSPGWLWLLLGAEAFLLLGGIVLIVLLLTGIL